MIPRSLVEASGDEGRVWVADRLEGVARLRTVKLGAVSGEQIAVKSGLTADDKVIVTGREGLKDGDRIRVTGEDERIGIEKK